MFRSKKYILQTKDKLFEICILLFIPKNKYILDISYEKGNTILVQCVSDNKLSYVSYITDNSDETLNAANVLFNFMQNNNLLIPVTLEKLIDYTINKEEEFTLVKPIQFNTNKHVFIAIIKENKESFFVKIGGLVFSGCMDIFIYKNRTAHVSQIYSEPECDAKFREDTFNAIDTVEMIKGALQVCQLLFDVNEFEFLDMSNIECDKSNYKSRKLPRRFLKPFSLTDLYLVTHCKTWYEYHFNARIKDIRDQELYTKKSIYLAKPVGLSLEEFGKEYYISNDYLNKLSKYYEPSKSIVEIVEKIPKTKRCDLLGWLPVYIEKTTSLILRFLKWVIELDNIVNNNITDTSNEIKQFNIYKYNTNTLLQPKKEINSIVTRCEKAIYDKPKTMIRTNMFIITKNMNIGGKFTTNLGEKYVIKHPKRKNNTLIQKTHKYNNTRKNYYKFRFSNDYYDYRTMYN
jgi:hypothetical protein